MSEGVTVAAETEAPSREGGRVPAKSSAGLRRFVPVLLVAGGLCLGYAFGLQHFLSLEFLAESRDVLRESAAAHPVLAPLLLVCVYALAVAFSFPAASVLTIFSGFLFGWLWGGILAIIAATLGAVALFLAARSAFGGVLRARLGGWAGKLAQGFAQGAFSFLLVLRFAPFMPFFIVNIAPAFFNVRLRTYLAATFFGIMPGAFAYAWLGQGVDSVLAAARAAGRSPDVADLVTPEITVAFLLLAAVAAAAALVKHVWAKRHAA